MVRSYSFNLKKLGKMKSKFFSEFFRIKNFIPILIALQLTNNSCVQYKEAWLNPKEKSTAIIPNLKPIIYIKSGRQEISGISYSDGVILLNNYIINNIIDNKGTTKGTIEITLQKNYHKLTNIHYFILSTLTVWTINLIGFPMLSQKVSISLNVKIKNNKGEVIKEFNEEGIGKATSAMYWGYPWYGALTKSESYVLPRTVNTFAVSDALNKLRESIIKDSKELNRRLYE